MGDSQGTTHISQCGCDLRAEPSPPLQCPCRHRRSPWSRCSLSFRHFCQLLLVCSVLARLLLPWRGRLRGSPGISKAALLFPYWLTEKVLGGGGHNYTGAQESHSRKRGQGVTPFLLLLSDGQANVGLPRAADRDRDQ